MFDTMIPRRVLGQLCVLVVGAPLLWAAGASGQTQRDLNRQRREYDIMRRAEEAGPGRETLWSRQELKKGKLVKKIVANPPAVWLGEDFGSLSPYQRDALLAVIYKEKYSTTKKPVTVSLYDVNVEGKQGKKVGSYSPKLGVKITGAKFKDAPEDADSEEKLFPLDPPAK